MIRRLRQLGYEGRFEVVYARRQKEKLGYLLPGFRAKGHDAQTLASGVTTIPFDLFDKSKPERVSLGISGADDRDLSSSYPKHPDLGVSYLLRLQPLMWHGSHEIKVAGRRSPINLNEELKDLGYVYDVASPSDPAEFVKHEMSAERRLSRKGRGLAAILDDGGRYEILPAYGLGYGGVEKFRRLLQAVRDAQRQSPQRFRGGVVIPLVSNFNAMEMASLTRRGVQSGSNGWKALYEAARTAYNLRVRSRTSVALAPGPDAKVMTVRDAGLARALENLKAGDILVVRVGSLPPSVFDYLFSRASMPATIAGKNASNLMRMLGRPFLNTVDSNDVVPDDNMLALAANSELKGIWNDDSIAYLTHLILESMNPLSALSVQYAAQRPKRQSLKSDKLALGLLKLQELMESDESERTLVAPVSGLPGY